VPGIYFGREPGALLQNRPGGIGVLPEARFGNLFFDLFKPLLFARQVKDTPLADPAVCRAPVWFV
jgi:hypothetical protein